MTTKYIIKHVAIYLRKSRGDEDKDLEQHRVELVELCEQSDWVYVEYAEIGTSDSIEARPKMMELLQDVEQGMYDAVLAVHIDRLSRGDAVDRAKIQKLFGRAETILVTPSKVYDFTNDTDIIMAEFQGLMARMEYKETSRRFRQGKARNAKAGFWSNGVPPFPYFRDENTKKAEPDESKINVYQMMKNWCLSGWVSSDIAWELNKMGQDSPRGGMWQPEVVRRLLLDEVHLGHIIVGKKRKTVNGDLVYKERVDWITYKNCHTPLKTQLEHDKICYIIKRDKSSPKASRAGKNEFSSLVHCSICNSTLAIQKNKNRPSDSIKSCTHRDPLGNRCSNLGGSVDFLIEAVSHSLRSKREQIEKALSEGLNVEEINHLQKILQDKLKEIREQEKVMERIFKNQEKNIYSKNEDENDRIFMERRKIAEKEMQSLEDEYRIIKTQVDASQSTKNEDMLISIDDVLEIVSDELADTKEKNRGYKSIIHSIEWEKNRIDHKPTIKINFL